MLILARKLNEEVIITVPPSQVEQRITVMLTDIRGDIVRLGFTAPKDIAIVREEIWGTTKEANND